MVGTGEVHRSAGLTEAGAAPSGAALARFDRLLERLTELAAAALVIAEVVLLFTGVAFRYVFDHPLFWTDELAEMLFLWLVSLGAVIALQRSVHMRMTLFVGRLSPAAQKLANRFAGMVVALVALGFLWPGIGYGEQQAAITTPALGIPGSWMIDGQLVALALLCYVALRQLLAGASWRELAVVLGGGAVIALAFWALEPAFAALGNADLVIFFIGVVGICIGLGVPIAFSFGIATFAYLQFTSTLPLSIIIGQADQGMGGIELLAVPMFVVLGLLLEMTGIARVMVDLLAALVGHRRGGLSYVLIGAMYLISGISGSKAADQAAVAPVLVPEMKRRGAAGGELASQLAAAAAMSETIPPSLVLIIVGSVTGVSTAALFTGGLLPAGIAALGLVVLVFFRSRHETILGERATWAQAGRLFVIAIPALILPFVIRYAVLEGVTTAVEVATVGVVYATLIGIFVYRCFEWRRVLPVLVETAALSGAILFIIGNASAMSWALTQAGFAQQLADIMTSLPGGRISFMALSIVVFLVLGSVLEGLPAMVLFGPLLFPIAQQLGIHQVQYAIVAILAMGIGLFAPPFGVGFYQSCLFVKVSSDEAFTRIVPYILTLIVSLLLIAAVPWFSIGFLH